MSQLCLLVVGAVCLAVATACAQKSGGETFLVSVDNAGNAGDGGSGYPAVSGDGRLVAFWSWAPNLTLDKGSLAAPHVVVRDRSLNQTTVLGETDISAPTGHNLVAVNSGGRYATFSSQDSSIVSLDTNETVDVFVRDLENGGAVRASVDSAGNQADGGSAEPAISADGHVVAFASAASNLVPGESTQLDIFVHDFESNKTERVSVDSNGNPGNDYSYDPDISGDGRYVAFTSLATNLVDDDANDSCDLDGDKFADDNCIDVFVHDRETGETTVASILSDGTQGDGNSFFPSISDDGRYVAFVSDSRNSLMGTHDAAWGFFVRDREKGVTTRIGVEPRSIWMDTVGGAAEALSMGMWGPSISGNGKWVAFVEKGQVVVSRVDGSEREIVSVSSDGGEASAQSDQPSISFDGSYVAFSSWSKELVAGDTGDASQVYLRERPTTTRVVPIGPFAALLLGAAVATLLLAIAVQTGVSRDRD